MRSSWNAFMSQINFLKAFTMEKLMFDKDNLFAIYHIEK